MRYRHSLTTLLAGIVLGSLLVSCTTGTAAPSPPSAGAVMPVPQTTPPAQTLLIPGEAMGGELAGGGTDRWIFATAGGRLATVEVWFRPATSSGPDAQVQATLVSPNGTVVAQESGTVTLPPYIVEQELAEAGSYLLRLDGLSGTPGQYTLMVTLSEERLLTRPEIYTGTLPVEEPSGADAEGGWGFIWPSPRRAISGWYFHDEANPGHNGLDIAAALHDPILAAASGTVSFAGPSGGYGNLVIIDHADGWQTWYAHLSHIAVTVGDRVGQGM